MLKGKLCDQPFWRMEIHVGGSVYHCCPGWLPISVGNIRMQSLQEIFASVPSQRIRDSILSGDYSYCERKLCPFLGQYLVTGQLVTPLNEGTEEELPNSYHHKKKIALSLCYDSSCNMHCPSCRNELKFFTESNIPPDILEVHQQALKNIKELLADGYRVYLNVTGSGDPFASPLYYKMLRELPAHPNLSLEIQTNGVLMDEAHFTENMRANTHFISVSVDAATKATYDRVRYGGDFDRLKRNLDWLNGAVNSGRFPKLKFFNINYIVQKENYAELSDFCRWILSYSAVTEIWFSAIADWGHLGSKAFAERAVWRKEHSEHEKFISHVRDPFLRSDKRITLGNLSEYL
jgi:sulfatase maturation enzyme AslB (radical SAM superfamily)